MLRQASLALLAGFLVCGSLLAADKEVTGKIVSLTAKSLVIAGDDGKKTTYTVNADTAVTDAKGKAIKDGLKDKTLVAGASVKLVLAAKGNVVQELQLTPATTVKDPVKDPVVKDPKKDPVKTPPVKEVSKGTPATIVKVDGEKRSVAVTLEGGKKAEYKLGEDVKFIGPRGGVSKEGIKDDRFVTGAAIGIVMDKGDKNVVEIHLPYRKSDKDKKENKDK